MTEESKKSGLLASVAKMFTPDPSKPSAPPPSCCGECGGGKKGDNEASKTSNASNNKQ